MNSQDLGSSMWWPPDQAAADEYIAYSEAYGHGTCLRHFDQVAGGARHLASGADAGAQIAQQLRTWIESRTPASLIRLGDADGNVLLSRMGGYPALNSYCMRKISQIYFGNQRLMPDEADFFARIVLDAVAAADVIGGPERSTIDKSFSTPFPKLDVRGMCGMRGVYNYLAERSDIGTLSTKTWASTWFSRALLPHYFGLLRGQSYIGLITCYPELGPMLKEKTGAGVVEPLLVPMQASIAKTNKDIKHYPDVYPYILEAIKPPHDGAVFIVAAGILSKPYCTRVKERGGIAIDVGSVADVWMNTQSRPGIDANFVEKWRIK